MSTNASDLNPKAGREFFGHPKGLSTLFMTEMWERFSFYGIRPLLILAMSTAMVNGGFEWFSREQAGAIVGIYASCVYLTSLPGGWIADRWLGLRKAIQIGAFLITIGHLCIGLSGFAESKLPFFVGLILIVLGTGLLKPNISAIVGDLYPEGGARRDAGFSIFYMGINLGSMLGNLVTGFLGERFGFHLGFGAAGVGMLFALLWFSFRAKSTLGDLGTEPNAKADPVQQKKQVNQIKVAVGLGLAILTTVVILTQLGVITIDPQVAGEYMVYVLSGIAIVFFGYIFILGKLTSDEIKRVVVILVLFVAAAVFWAAFEQAPTSLNLFAKDFTDRSFFGMLSEKNWFPATWFQAVNSALIVIFAPVFAWLWTWFSAKNINISSPVKFALGLVMAAIGFGLMIFPSNMLVAAGGLIKVAPWWLVASYLFQTFGELMVSPVGLSSMTKLSPRRFVGQMMGIWFLATSLGNLIAGLVGGRVDPNKLEQTPQLFTWTAIALIGSAIVLGLLAIPIARMMKGQPDTVEEAA